MILRDQKIFMGKRQLTTDLMSISLDGGVEPQDDTRFGDTTRQFEAGLVTMGWGMEGFWSSAGGAGDVDDELFANLALNGVPLSVMALGAGVGDRAFLMSVLESEYVFGGEVGTIHKFTAGGQVARPAPGVHPAGLVRGFTMFNGTASSTANGTAVEVGAAASGQRIYGALHVTAASGTTPTLDVVIESDDAQGFASGTTRITFAQATATTSEFKTLDGPVTDSWWRIAYTIGGTTPSFTFAVVLGIY